MQFLTVALAAASLIAPSLAAPVAPAGYEWKVSQWTAGCNNDYCTYNFYVKAPQNGNIPQFSARCTGTDTGKFASCKLLSASQEVEVAAKLNHQANPSEPVGPAQMSLMYSFKLEQSGVDLIYTGGYAATYNKGSFDSGRKFQVTPSHLTGN